MKIYVASSWKNQTQPSVVEALREHGHEVYDFRHPREGNNGFHWSEIDENYLQWTVKQYKSALETSIAERGFSLDWNAMNWADACVLVLPCNRSAHLEAGWFKGHGKKLYIFLPDNELPELMYKIADNICNSIPNLTEAIQREETQHGERVTTK